MVGEQFDDPNREAVGLAPITAPPARKGKASADKPSADKDTDKPTADKPADKPTDDKPRKSAG
jgi:hypothetical protein